MGTITRGTTAPNRLRRIDRWLAAGDAGRALARADDPLVVDLGFGASPVTTLELARRLRRVRADVEVVGVEIDPERVRRAEQVPAPPGVRFVRGGFELGGAGLGSGGQGSGGLGGGGLGVAGRRPVLVRAANVWRQYPVDEVQTGWAQVAGRLAPGGVLVDATCSEDGRRAAWLAVPAGSYQACSLTISLRLAELGRPSDVAERLPKLLIHRNVPGEPVHAWLQALDDAWQRAASQAGFGARQRFLATVADVKAQGWPVLDGPRRWRLGEVSLAWPPPSG